MSSTGTHIPKKKTVLINKFTNVAILISPTPTPPENVLANKNDLEKHALYFFGKQHTLSISYLYHFVFFL